MQTIKPTANAHQWPRKAAPSIECRKRDLVVRIADWSRQSIQSGEPAFDVEVYIKGVYDWNESASFTLRALGTKQACKHEAIKYAQAQIAKLL